MPLFELEPDRDDDWEPLLFAIFSAMLGIDVIE